MPGAPAPGEGGAADEPVLAVHIGAVQIAAGLIDGQGRVNGRATAAAPVEQGGEAVLRAAIELARSVAGEARPSSVGIGALGLIDAERGVVVRAPDDLPGAAGTLAGWAGADLAGAFAAEFSVPAVALNEVHARALGEARHGAGSAARSMVLVSVGAGVGGACVLDGQVVRGAHGVAGQVGHLPVPAAAGVSCRCGGTGHLEAVACDAGILAAYRAAVQARGAAGRAEYDVADTREIAQKAREFSAAGELCKSVLTQAGHVLGRAVGTLLNLFDPDVVVLAGDVPQLPGQAWSIGVSAGVAREALAPVADSKIAVARLGDDAVLVGAAAFARDRAAAG